MQKKKKRAVKITKSDWRIGFCVTLDFDWLDELDVIGGKHAVVSVRRGARPPTGVNLLDVCDNIIWIKRDLRLIL